VLVDVRRPPFGTAADDRTIVPACAFHRSVAAAFERVRNGEHLAFLGLAPDEDPAIDVGLPVGDRSYPGGIVRVRHDDQWLHVVGTTLGLTACRAALAAGPDHVSFDAPAPGRVDGEPVTDAVRLGFHWDPATEVTLLHAACPAGCVEDSDRRVRVLEGALGRCVVDELLGSLAPG